MRRISRKTITILKCLIFLLVILGMWQSVTKGIVEIDERGFSFSDIRFQWIGVAGTLYLLGTLPMGCFWYLILRSLGQSPSLAAALRAYYIGHLGKYVPGKAFVVVIRASLVSGTRVDATIAAVAVFVETLTMMAVGAFIASGLLVFRISDQRLPRLLALSLMVVTGLPLLPPIFRRIVRILQVRRLNESVDAALNGLTFRLMATGFGANLVGWTLLGASLWATMKAIPLSSFLGAPMETAPLMLASVALAMVAGFLSLIPGGAGVREWVLLELLAPHFGNAVALASAVLLRLAWLFAEALLATVLYFPIRGRHVGGVEPDRLGHGGELNDSRSKA